MATKNILEQLSVVSGSRPLQPSVKEQTFKFSGLRNNRQLPRQSVFSENYT
jgi:hypothetical protein